MDCTTSGFTNYDRAPIDPEFEILKIDVSKRGAVRLLREEKISMPIFKVELTHYEVEAVGPLEAAQSLRQHVIEGHTFFWDVSAGDDEATELMKNEREFNGFGSITYEI